MSNITTVVVVVSVVTIIVLIVIIVVVFVISTATGESTIHGVGFISSVVLIRDSNISHRVVILGKVLVVRKKVSSGGEGRRWNYYLCLFFNMAITVGGGDFVEE
ncbi:hypothetical protein HAX54_029136 [Datura stramonium]|uniref:Transmembrane protein n=1 Tax=Datura stramonium TaxID=4076 RepID=A0ABS8SA33_DATST|nr:hypothetical protein [Datura stramonium]